MRDQDHAIISINDVVDTLVQFRGRDWDTDDGLAFASDLTGISVDALWEMVSEREKFNPEDYHIGKMFRDLTFGLDWTCTEVGPDYAVLQNQPPIGASIRLSKNNLGTIRFEAIQNE